MPGNNYYGIKEKIIEKLSLKDELSSIVMVPSLQLVDNFLEPRIEVDLIRRRAMASQPIAAGTRVNYEIDGVILVTCGGMEHDSVIKLRDTFTAVIEETLMANRTLDGLVETILLTGGDMITGYVQEGGYHVAGSEINFIAHMKVYI